MNSVETENFNFDEWAALALSDAAAFERRRREWIEATLAFAPADRQARLRGLQFVIDMERQRAGSALGSAVRLNSMMWSSFHGLRCALGELSGIEASAATPRRPGATLLHFPKRP